MYIPLDNLYDWVASHVHDTLIYRFYPPGEKNLSKLTMLSDHVMNLHDTVACIPILCQDQEVLHYDHYQLSWQQLRDLCQQAWPLNNDYRILHDNQAWWENLRDQNMASVVFGSINAITSDRLVLLHSEKRSQELEKFQNIAVGAYWWSHGIIARDWYRYAQHDTRLHKSQEHVYAKDFNIYSRAWIGSREYRLAFLNQVIAQGMQNACRITFSHTDNDIHYQDHVFTNTNFKITQDLDCLPNDTISSHSSATYDYHHYQLCAIDVVLETLFDDERLHLTEKTLRPIACGQPFILASTHGSLAYLRNYGFETFGEFIDETYDTVQDPVERLQSICREMQRITQLPQGQKVQLWKDLGAVAQRNQQHFFSDAFAEQIKQELVDNVSTATSAITNTQTGQRWAKQRRTLTRQQRNDSLNYNPPTTAQLRSELAQHLRHSN
jgi:hypothetical protein